MRKSNGCGELRDFFAHRWAEIDFDALDRPAVAILDDVVQKSRLEHGVVVAKAGLLHDVVEDCDSWTIERIEVEFGPAVRDIVAQLTEDKSQSWEARKRDGIERVARLSAAALAVKAADKLHNLESLLAELRASDDHARVWARYNGGRERTIAMSSELVRALEARADPRIARPLRKTLDEILATTER